jgi:hypothetical protein
LAELFISQILFIGLAENSWSDQAAVDTKAFKAIHLINEAENMSCHATFYSYIL